MAVDRLLLPGVAVQADIGHGLPFRTSSLDFVRSHNQLEHVEDLLGALSEIHRVLKPEGTAEITVPHFSNPYYYSDPTHVRPFGLYSFDYFTEREAQKGRRRVNGFYSAIRFDILEKHLRFHAPKTVKVLKPLYWFAEWFFNLTPGLQETYEGLFSSVLVCRTIRVVLKPVKNEAEQAAQGS